MFVLLRNILEKDDCMGGIYCSYEILNAKDLIVPNDAIEGRFFIRSQERNAQILKNVEIQLCECYEKYELSRKGVSSWDKVEKELKNYQVSKGDTIFSGETKMYPFFIHLIPAWNVRNDHSHRGWYLELRFCQKTGLFTNRGENKDEATCILPVMGTTRAPSFHRMFKANPNPPVVQPVVQPVVIVMQNPQPTPPYSRSNAYPNTAPMVNQSSGIKLNKVICPSCNNHVNIPSSSAINSRKSFFCEFCGAQISLE